MFAGLIGKIFPAKEPPPLVPESGEVAQKRLRRVEIVASQLVQEVFGGQYESLFKGQGIEFSEIREYFPGDDVRNIDWNVTARLGRPFIKRNDEERELSMVLLLDSSASMEFGSANLSKKQMAGELAAILAFSALQNGDKVGLVRFSQQVDHVLPPRKGRKHVMRVLGEMLNAPTTASANSSDIAGALDAVCRIYKKKALVFVLSDFLSPPFEGALKRAAKRHDLSCFRFYDRREEEMPNVGRVRLRDLESGQAMILDTSAKGFAAEYKQRRQAARNDLKKMFDNAQVDYGEFSTLDDPVPTLSRFFANKLKKKRRTRRTPS